MDTSSDLLSFARALRVGGFEFTWRAQDEAWLPRFKGSTIRGAIGWAFKRVVCVRPDGQCELCTVRSSCRYPYVFETSPPPDVPVFRGQRFAPHPYVLEPPLEEKERYAPGEPLTFGLWLFGRAVADLPYVILAAEQAGRAGIGRGRARFTLETVRTRDADGGTFVIYDGSSRRFVWEKGELCLEAFIQARQLRLQNSPGDRVRLRFITPTRVRVGGDLQGELPFDLFVRSLLRRLWQLVLVHGDEPKALDHRSLIERAQAIPAVHQALVWRDWERYSHRQRTKMRLGGFVGEIEYELKENARIDFLPLLIAGELVHVGTGTTFGLGKYVLEIAHHESALNSVPATS
ncbi:MAG: CRISPR system precrRNA processing endoribonuclease RAMP protein Cas6 [Blastocatellia bacterium]|nr:CRISPR system precrRNA processing endoribonuclease RAMP protein Cas6 [Blastocatellia bacterium]MCS7157319.1 CRISPR system precrRNA processing endoribonuclease RAMP protein Cas6 [Blastocatellia bacterium]MCX7753185.1 CRISPR system precrRNA processing endoribonuclease RAMP protein Cas6 [Blastocatellia bacterium]MDW8168223.1 CRISPR system precrRNA processing endoribonuclease RAMP protein Cas6 [Acidobacteriota bacterium]MDW8255483.1 CRISPR system precrRNA processing endoribonuclease RAMP protein